MQRVRARAISSRHRVHSPGAAQVASHVTVVCALVRRVRSPHNTSVPTTTRAARIPQGIPVEPSAHAANFTDAFNRLIVIKGNTIESNGGIVVRGTSANVLVEGNTILQSDVGIHVNTTTTKGGIVLRNNEEPAGVPPNFNPYCTQ